MALAAPGGLDLLICDIDLPDGNGCDLLRRLRDFFSGRAIPAIAVTGHDGWIEECRCAGYASYLSKPLRLDDVLGAVRATYTSIGAPGLGCSSVTGLGGVPVPNESR